MKDTYTKESNIRISEGVQLCHQPILLQQVVEDNNRVIGRVPFGTVGDY